jgi:hypothetical protein
MNVRIGAQRRSRRFRVRHQYQYQYPARPLALHDYYTVLIAFGVLRNLIGGFAATRVSGLVIDCSAFRTLLPPPGCIFSNGICILGTCKSILLYLLFLLRRAGA